MAQAITPKISEGRLRSIERRRAQISGASASAARPTRGQVAARPVSPTAPTATRSTPVASNRQVSPVGAATTGRAASLQRRNAMSSQGKRALSVAVSANRTRAHSLRERAPVQASLATSEKRDGCGCGGRENAQETSAVMSTLDTSSALARSTPKVKTNSVRRSNAQAEGRLLSQARRRMLAERGRAGVVQSERVRSPVERVRQLNPDLSSRELAQEMRNERSRSGGRGQKSSGPSGRKRPSVGGAEDATWKVGSSETVSGQTITGTQVGRSRSVTGDEPSTCRTITGTEYMAADIFREFCQTELVPNPNKVSRTKTAAGRSVTGTEVGRSAKVTGNEAGNCKRVTGNEYLPADQVSDFCGIEPTAPAPKLSITQTARGSFVSGSNVDRPSKVTGTEAGANRATTGTAYVSPLTADAQPATYKKVGTTSTLRGGQVTGVIVGRSSRVTGDEPGTCRLVTGDEYVGSEQYEAFCDVKPRPEPAKVGLSETAKGKVVTGTQTGRAQRVTGDEPGTCKAVTGTPYAGIENYRDFCAPQAAGNAVARSRVGRSTPAMPLTGLQPGVGGKLTGASKGACEAITGTPYVGQDQLGANCGNLGAAPGNPDFPQSLDGVPWTSRFSVSTPARDAQRAQRQSGVTGTRYEQGNITGPFVMGEGKITGTEQFRFGARDDGARGVALVGEILANSAVDASGQKSRVTGEGIDSGLRITGDDWGRNDRVTGTEGRSAARRNPTRRGTTAAPMAMSARREHQQEKPVEVASSKVTGSSGNTEKGALITVSGGARG